jgi:hypothetical protein
MTTAMKPCHWCGTATFSHNRVCQDCRGIDKRRNVTPPADHALTGGRWVLGPNRIQVWQPDYVATANTPPGTFNPNQIACPCGATVTETCRTKTGRRTRSHEDRKLPRNCQCGGPVESGRQLCGDCRHAAAIESRRAYRERKTAA